MRVDIAVEPTRSENITVTWRRSAVSCGFGLGGNAGSGMISSNRRQHLSPMPERDAKVLKVLVGQMSQYGGINVVLGKALGVLGHAELSHSAI